MFLVMERPIPVPDHCCVVFENNKYFIKELRIYSIPLSSIENPHFIFYSVIFGSVPASVYFRALSNKQ
jgi:hypothetical protein